MIVHTASANLLGKVLVYPAKVTVLLRPLGRFTEEVVSTHGGGRTGPVARLTGTLTLCLVLTVNLSQSFFQE